MIHQYGHQYEVYTQALRPPCVNPALALPALCTVLIKYSSMLCTLPAYFVTSGSH